DNEPERTLLAVLGLFVRHIFYVVIELLYLGVPDLLYLRPFRLKFRNLGVQPCYFFPNCPVPVWWGYTFIFQQTSLANFYLIVYVHSLSIRLTVYAVIVSTPYFLRVKIYLLAFE